MSKQMHKLTFKNQYDQIIEAHGQIGAIVFIPNEGEPICLRKNEFLKIERV